MIDVREHVYDDNPKAGPPDVRTRLKDVSYFFLGNGLIQAAVQAAPSGEGTPVGLLIMNPEKLRKKREALTMDPAAGLGNTMIRVREGGETFEAVPHKFEASWSRESAVPAVSIRWKSCGLEVHELFYCPDFETAVLHRRVNLQNRKSRSRDLLVTTGVGTKMLEKKVCLPPGGEVAFLIAYILDIGTDEILVDFKRRSAADRKAVSHWKGLTSLSFGNPRLDRFFSASKYQLPAVVSRAGRVDGGVWQYNGEWLRDQAMVALALTMTGNRGLARTMFERLLDRFVTDEGDTIDSSEKRDPDEVELDQAGFLLTALKDYVLWTADLELARLHWKKIVAAAEFPLRKVFRHRRSGLLMNQREFWERHGAHGIEPGLELAHELYESLGLSAGAVLARMMGDRRLARRWDKQAARLKRAMLDDSEFRLLDHRGFIKRRGLDGSVQEKIQPLPGSGLPVEVPLGRSGNHFLNPDTSAALPIALGFVGPESPVCRATLGSLEALWNQVWTGGGYGRYHASSEPDSPGAWPFPSLFVARASVEMGEFENVQRILDWLESVPGAKSGSWFEFYGERISPPFPQVGIVPWNWAELIVLFIHHFLGFRPQEAGIWLGPRLIPGLKMVRAEIRIRERRLSLECRLESPDERIRFETGGRVLEERPNAILLEYPSKDIKIKLWSA
jgi:hypothetical protein